eukprot:gene8143-9558_t
MTPIQVGDLPEQLETLRLSNYHHSLFKGVLPDSLRRLTLSDTSSCSRKYDIVIPFKLKTLHFQCWSQRNIIIDDNNGVHNKLESLHSLSSGLSINGIYVDLSQLLTSTLFQLTDTFPSLTDLYLLHSHKVRRIDDNNALIISDGKVKWIVKRQ